MERVSILIADDHPVYRFGLATLLSTEAAFEVLGEAGTGDEAVALAKELSPDVVLMDIHMPGLNGVDATREIRAACPETRVLVISMLDDETVFSALKAGASGYLLKGTEGEVTIQALHVVAEGGTIFSPGIAARVLAHFSSEWVNAQLEPFPELTARERETLELIAKGLTNAAIADWLVLSPKTVRNLVSEIYHKLRVSSRGEAVVKAKNAGLG